jgi:triacylglycerol lipase
MGFWREDLGLLPPDSADRLALEEDGLGWNAGVAYSLANVAALAYEREKFVREFLGDRGWDVQAIQIVRHLPWFKAWSETGWLAARRGEDLILAFRGTEPPSLFNWLTNLAVAPMAASKFIAGAVGRVHAGFGTALAAVWPEIERTLRRFAEEGGKRLWLTGHSLGGALAFLAATAVGLANPGFGGMRLAGLYTCGQPRVGDRAFVEAAMEKLAGRYFRIVHGSDIVPHVPPEFLALGILRRIVRFFWKLFGGGESTADYVHGGTVVYVPAGTGLMAEAIPAGFPNSVEEIAKRMGPVAWLLPGLVGSPQETVGKLPVEIRHHFPRGTSEGETSYVSRLRQTRG